MANKKPAIKRAYERLLGSESLRTYSPQLSACYRVRTQQVSRIHNVLWD